MNRAFDIGVVLACVLLAYIVAYSLKLALPDEPPQTAIIGEALCLAGCER